MFAPLYSNVYVNQRINKNLREDTMKEQMKELQKLKEIGEVLSRSSVESCYYTIATDEEVQS
jgi:hypothetical protein